MKKWDQRPFEIRNLFNPAFCGLVLFRSIQSYEEIDPKGMPFSLSLLVLPLCLHEDTRNVFKASIRSYLLKILGDNPQVQIGFSDRVTSLIPYTYESFGFLMERGCITISEDGCFLTVPDKIRKTISGTFETKACQQVSRYIGKQFALIHDKITIYTIFGVRP